MSLFRVRTLALGTALLLAACGEKAPETPPPAAPETVAPPAIVSQHTDSLTYAPQLNVDLTKMTKDSLGIYSQDLVVGKGATAEVGKTVMVRYTGWFADGTEFDANHDQGYQVTIGEHRVVNGWEVGLVGMKVGGKRLLVIPPAQGYPEGRPPLMPPGMVLVFVVEIASVQ